MDDMANTIENASFEAILSSIEIGASNGAKTTKLLRAIYNPDALQSFVNYSIARKGLKSGADEFCKNINSKLRLASPKILDANGAETRKSDGPIFRVRWKQHKNPASKIAAKTFRGFVEESKTADKPDSILAAAKSIRDSMAHSCDAENFDVAELLAKSLALILADAGFVESAKVQPKYSKEKAAILAALDAASDAGFWSDDSTDSE